MLSPRLGEAVEVPGILQQGAQSGLKKDKGGKNLSESFSSYREA